MNIVKIASTGGAAGISPEDMAAINALAKTPLREENIDWHILSFR